MRNAFSTDDLRNIYFKNKEVSAPLYKFNSFTMDSGLNTWGSYGFDKETLRRSMLSHGLPSAEISFDSHKAFEWGNSFFLSSDIPDGGGLPGGGGFSPTPLNRTDALNQLKSWIYSHYSIPEQAVWESNNGHYLWQHYAAEFGAAYVGCEVGESISSTQAHIAFSRGAGRQYSIPWFTDFSFWHQGYINDYSGKNLWGTHSTETGGHSPSLYKRTFLASYMGGTSHFYSEAIADIAFMNEKNSYGYYKLSPIGEALKDINGFIKSNSDVGINYTPFGIVIDRNHGMFSGDTRVSKKKAFQVFDYNSGDEMTYKLFDMFFPGSWNVIGSDEANYQVNGPYGDTCDALLQNSSLEVLKSYPCLILSGDISLSEEEVRNYMSYVSDGGTLVLNTAYLDYFPEYKALYNNTSRQDIAFSKGTVIIYGGDYELAGLDSIIKEQLKDLIPFEFSKDVEYLVNVKAKSLIVTLINNKDYYFNRATGENTDFSKTLNMSLKYTGAGKIKSVNDLWSEETAAFNNNLLNLTIAPGETKVLEFNFN